VGCRWWLCQVLLGPSVSIPETSLSEATLAWTVTTPTTPPSPVTRTTTPLRSLRASRFAAGSEPKSPMTSSAMRLLALPLWAAGCSASHEGCFAHQVDCHVRARRLLHHALLIRQHFGLPARRRWQRRWFRWWWRRQQEQQQEQRWWQQDRW
jgi:hypothetical protein